MGHGSALTTTSETKHAHEHCSAALWPNVCCSVMCSALAHALEAALSVHGTDSALLLLLSLVAPIRFGGVGGMYSSAHVQHRCSAQQVFAIPMWRSAANSTSYPMVSPFMFLLQEPLVHHRVLIGMKE